MLRASSLVAALFAATLSTGCVVRGRVGATAYVEEPELEYVSPGVYVVADAEEPIFFSDGFYWLNRGGVWYRSRSYGSGWVYVSAPAYRVRVIGNPRAYVHYRASGRVRGRGPVRGRPAPVYHRGPQRVPVRDHRTH